MLMHVDGKMLQTAVLHDGNLAEFYMERSEGSNLLGNVYKGRVVNVLPGMQAAFVDIGLNKNAFLYIDDLLHPHLEKQPAPKPSIQELAWPGQELIVQVVKEPLGGKGARVSTHFNLAGHWLVYMPYADYVGVSRKIGSDQARERLRDIGERLRLPEEGIIMRTAAEGESEEALSKDAEQLRQLWHYISEQGNNVQAPALLHSEADLMHRTVRDSLTLDVDEVWIDNQQTFGEVSKLLLQTTPVLCERLRLHDQRETVTLFDKFHVTEQIEIAFGRRIPLDSGGYLIWEETEALTVVDVNTGKFTGTDSLENTVFQTNMEAAELIVRLLRIRDVGGIVIIDFIDMEQESNRQKILATMAERTRGDGTKCTIVGWTRLGLLELTRKKTRENAALQLTESCQLCGGKRVVGKH